ncbi:MAG: phospholipid carrier-dependent glycosyltransferase [Candidatus Blackburnbacteria bacterium]|nr:phospholipid carrier-dependent glycosyltransferase [Candidatus Blackburnbacteria bacterium]
MQRNSFALLFLIVIFGLGLRLYNISDVPPSLNWDEVSHGYNAYSILRTGRDEWGKQFPVTNFRAYGDYPLPLNLYFLIPSVAVFGLTEFGIRFPHVILGTLTIISSFFLAYGVARRRVVGFLVALLVAIEPWYVFPSRFVLQSNMSVFLIITSMALFFNREKHRIFLPLAAFLLGLTLFAYHSTRIFSPLLLLAVIFIYRPDLFKCLKKESVLSMILWGVASVFFLSLPVILLNNEARARANWVFLIDQGAVNKIIESRSNSHLPPILVKAVYNRPVYFIKAFSQRYVEYFSPEFLFYKGGTHYQFSVPDTGLLYKINLPFFYLGLFCIICAALKRKKDYIFVTVWFLLAPIPASITQEHFAVLRSTTFLPLPQLSVALGFLFGLDLIKRKFGRGEVSGKVAVTLYVALLLIELEGYLTVLFTEYNQKYSWAWQYGYKQVAEYAKQRYGNYDKFIVTKKYGEPHEFFLFYLHYDPRKYMNDLGTVRYFKSDWYWVDGFDKFYFLNDWNVVGDTGTDGGTEFVLESGGTVDCRMLRCLMITSPGNYPLGWRLVETIYFLDGKTAFEILENI